MAGREERGGALEEEGSGGRGRGFLWDQKLRVIYKMLNQTGLESQFTTTRGCRTHTLVFSQSTCLTSASTPHSPPPSCPAHLPPYRLLQGVGRPDEVLACVEVGVDLFESFFPFQVTERGCALSFSFHFSPDPERAGSAPPAGVVNSCA